MRTRILRTTEPNVFQHALDVLRHDGLVAFPTDTVYGLAALAFRPEAVERLYIAKGRNHTKAIAILLGDASELEKVALNPGEMAQRLAQALWPGPVTLVVPGHPALPEELSPLKTVGVRVPDHPVALKLLQLAGPLAVTSANLSGEKSTTTANEVLQQLNGRIHLILDGGSSPGGMPSTVVDCSGTEPVILREGPITMAALQAVLAEDLNNPDQPQAPKAS